MSTEPKKITLFDMLNDLTHKKEYIIDGNESAYVPFMINKGLSQQPDLIFIANEMNKSASTLTKEMQYDFYFHSINAKKRYGKWTKSESDDEMVELVAELYNVSKMEAREYLTILSKENIQIIKNMERGGVSKKGRKKK